MRCPAKRDFGVSQKGNFKIKIEMKRIKICSLDFLMYAHERRLEEDEMMDEGYMEEYERLSLAEMRRSYAEYLRDLASE